MLKSRDLAGLVKDSGGGPRTASMGANDRPRVLPRPPSGGDGCELAIPPAGLG